MGWYRVARGLVLKQFKAESIRVAGAVKAGRDIAPVLKAERKNWNRIYQRVYLGAGEEFARHTIAELDKGKAVKADGWQRIVTEYLRYESGRRIKGIEATTLGLVRNALADGADAGEGMDLIAQRVSDAYDRFSTYRASTISRTEVVGASGIGSRAGAISTGLKLTHTWLSTRDQRTRDDHLDVDGQTKPMDEPFQVAGDELMFPGDSSMGASAGNVIQCRCTETYEVRR